MKRQLRPSYCIYLDKRHSLWCIELWEKEEIIFSAYRFTYCEAYKLMTRQMDQR